MSDPSRYEALVDAHSGVLLRYLTSRAATPEDAADLLADTFLTAWRRSADVPADDHEAKLWLFGIATNNLKQHRRALRRRSALAQRLADQLRTDRETHHQHEPPEAALARLSELDREIIRLVHWGGLSLADTARLLNQPEGTIRSRYHRARAHLRSQLASRPTASKTAAAQ